MKKTSRLLAITFWGSVVVLTPLSSAVAQSTPSLATVVAACGTPPSTYLANQNRPVLQDTTGKVCDTGGGGGGGSTTANQGTPNAGGATNSWPVQGAGTAGTPAGGVVSIQGVASGTPLSVSTPLGTTFAPAQVTLSTSAVQVLPPLATPAGRFACNFDTAIVEYIGAAGVTSSTGIKVPPGACWDASHTTAALDMVAASGTPIAAVVQY